MEPIFTKSTKSSVNKAAHSIFETQRRRHEKFKTGVSVAPQKGLMSSKNVLKSLQNHSLPLIAIVLQQ